MMPKMLERLTMRASSLRVQERQKRARHPHHAPEVDAEQPFEIGFADLLERAGKRDARIVDKHIDAGVFGRHLSGNAATASRSETSR